MVRTAPKQVNLSSVLPEPTKARLERAGIPTESYPFYPDAPKDVATARATQAEPAPYQDRGLLARKDKHNLFSAAQKVINLTEHIGTEIVGLQLSQLTDDQKNELALLISERTVVFFRDQDLTPQAQRELGLYLGPIEVHPTSPQVPGLPGISIIWDKLSPETNLGFRNQFGTSNWHTDLTHEKAPPGYTHLHNDTVPEVGGDTYWASGYSAYDKLSPKFRTIVDGLSAVYRSAHEYKDEDGNFAPIETVHPLVRVHPVTGWKSLFINRRYTLRIVGLDPAESKTILEYLFNLYETSLDIQVRFKWTPNTSALWDNRISIHAAVYDYGGLAPRHGTRVSTYADVPSFDKDAPSRRAALGLDKPEDFTPRQYANGY